MYRALPVLLEHDFEVRSLNGRFDPAGTPTVWLLAWNLTRLDDCAFAGFVDELIRPLGGLAHEFPSRTYPTPNWRNGLLARPRWYVMNKLTDVSISDGMKRYSIDSFALAMAMQDIANTVEAGVELGVKAIK